jgi:AraC-like DNA-binding protein
MRNSFLLFLLFGLPTLLSAQHTLLDSLMEELKKHSKEDTTQVRLLTSISWNAWGTEPQKTKTFAEQALLLAEKINDTRGMGDAYKGICRYYWTQTEYNKAMDYALMAVKEYEQCNYPQGISWCYGSIGLSYAQAHNHDKSIEYHSRALELNKKIKNKTGIARDLNNLGYTYELKKDYQRSLEYYQKALSMRIELADRPEIILPHSNVGSAYLYLGNYTLSLQYFFKALDLAKEFNNKNMIALNYQNIGEATYKTGNYKDAEFFLLQALRVGNEIGDKKRREDVYEVFTGMEESRKNFSAALRYQRLLQDVRDTLYTQDRSRQMAEMETRFETEKKEQAIRILEQEKRIQNLWNNILVAGLIMLIIVFLIIYWILRYREGKNMELFSLQIDYLSTQRKELAEKYKLALIDQKNPTMETNDQRLFKKALDIVEKNISDPLFGVEKMAEEMGMSRANLHRKLKAITGFSPSDFIRGVRLKRAADLLRNQTDSVAQIGFTVGFEDQSYFSKSFKKQFGVSPSEYFRSAN